MNNLDYNVLTCDYEKKVYAGVLGKIIGVYLGRPFEQWSNERIERELGEIHYYVHEKLGKPLIVTDDDITGTFAFLRALPENGNDPTLTPAQIGDWWRNVIIENKSILWWGGMGLSTEHTAFMRLKAGIKAPDSGSIATNGVAVAEEIGAQIFIDGWGMICPGDPAQAVEWARRAGSVSHDGEAIYGAQIVAALIALAFVETDLHVMLDKAVEFIPKTSLIYELIQDMRVWVADNGDDWRATLAHILEKYPYSRFGTNCPMVSNHAIIILALLHGGGNFSRSMMIANTAGYDTDCNSGNVGCILGVMLGLEGLDAGDQDWRGPVADRIYLPTAEGGRTVTDALSAAYEIIDSARALQGQPPTNPKSGARFHFSLPGSVQGWQSKDLTVGNESGKLSLRFAGLTSGLAGTATFVAPEALNMGGYELSASPRLYPGQTVTASVSAPTLASGINVGLYVKAYSTGKETQIWRGPVQQLTAETETELTFLVPDTDGQPIYEVGLEVTSDTPIDGTLLLDWLTWTGMPDVVLKRPEAGGEMWGRAWVNGADAFRTDFVSPNWTYRIIQNSGTGLVTQGETTWENYCVSAEVLPHLSNRIGLIAAGRGLRRYIALMLDGDKRVRLVRQHDDAYSVLADSDIVWAWDRKMSVSLSVTDGKITASVDGQTLEANTDGLPVQGAVGFLADTGTAEWRDVTVNRT